MNTKALVTCALLYAAAIALGIVAAKIAHRIYLSATGGTS